MDSRSASLATHAEVPSHAPHVAEQRTRWIVIVTLAMMAGELLVGWWSGSMALTADGWHMGTHAGALALTASAYWFARTHADNDAFAFGTGKVYALAGYTSGVLLGVVAVWMAVEGAIRLATPHTIEFDEALWVAVLGLLVNVGCALLLGHPDGHGHGHGHGAGDHPADQEGHHGRSRHHVPSDHAHHDHDHDHDHDHRNGHRHDHDHRNGHGHDLDHRDGHDHEVNVIPANAAYPSTAVVATTRHSPRSPHDSSLTVAPRAVDHNLRAAYLHIVADAVTSVLAIVALLLGRYVGWWFMDPVMGIIGGAVILSWSIGLCRQASRQLLDMTTSPQLETWIRNRLEEIDDVKVAGLHVWLLAPGKHGCVVSLRTARPRRVDHYHHALRSSKAISHLTIEIYDDRNEILGPANG
jgi:cation diffusion facilitator family transporter